MPAINRATLLRDLYMWLPEQNTLSDEQMLILAESVISTVGDDDTNRSEVTCKTLKACALANRALNVGGNDVKREKSYQREIEFHNRNDTDIWSKYIDRLSDICPLLPGGGYRIPVGNVGFYANVSDPVLVPNLTKINTR